MSSVPDESLDNLWDTLIAGNDVTVVALDSSHTYDQDTSQFLADVDSSAIVSDPIVLTYTTDDGVLGASNYSLTGVGNGVEVVALCYYADTGSDATSPILAFSDTVGGSPMSFTGDGNPISVTLPSGRIASI